MKVIAGLGNPGIEYFHTRHNAGFRVIDELATRLARADDTSFGAHFLHKKDLFADIAKVTFSDEDLLLVKPTTYMNLSGQAVAAILHWYKIDSARLLIVHDDVSLPLGKLRFQQGGGAGGQHGVESILEYCGSNQAFERLKIGVGPDPGGDKRADFVLTPIGSADCLLFKKVIETAALAVTAWLNVGIEKAMNKFNGLDLLSNKDAPADQSTG